MAATTLAKLWLARRHLAYIAAHRAAVPNAFHEQIQLADHQKAADYTSAKTRFDMLGTLFDAALLLAFTLGGGIQFIAGMVSAELGNGWFSSPIAQGMATIVAVLILYALLEAPFNIYRTFVIEARFGFNKMTFKLYLLDALKGILIGAVLGLPLLFGVLWLMGRMGTYWWLYVWLVWVVFNLLVLFIYPSFIAPLFNKFSPMQDEAMKSRIESLLKRCGFTAQGPVRDGRIEAQRARQRLLHRLRQDQAHRVLRHAAGTPERQ